MVEASAVREAVGSSARVEVQDVRRDRRAARLRVAGSIAALLAVPWALGVVGLPAGAVVAALVAVAAYFWSALSLAAVDRGPGERRLGDGRVELAGDRLIVTAGRATAALPLSELAGGWTEWTSRGHAAVLSFSDGRVVAIERASEEEATELLAVAGAGVQARAVRMRGYREDTGGRKIAGCFLALFAPLLVPLVVTVPVLLVMALTSWSTQPLGVLLALVAGSAPYTLLCAWLWSKVTPTWIHIGTDGVMLRGAFRDRFFSHGAILAAVHTKGGVGDAYHFVEIALRDGRSHTVPAASEEEATALIRRLHAARAVSTDQEQARLLEVISRAGRPLSEWRRALSSLMTRSGYRTAAHDLEEMLRIVEDPRAPREQRVAAALAAHPHGGDPARKRIHVAAEACAEPKLRVALESASAGEIDDDLLEEIGSKKALGALAPKVP